MVLKWVVTHKYDLFLFSILLFSSFSFLFFFFPQFTISPWGQIFVLIHSVFCVFLFIYGKMENQPLRPIFLFNLPQLQKHHILVLIFFFLGKGELIFNLFIYFILFLLLLVWPTVFSPSHKAIVTRIWFPLSHIWPLFLLMKNCKII